MEIQQGVNNRISFHFHIVSSGDIVFQPKYKDEHSDWYSCVEKHKGRYHDCFPSFMSRHKIAGLCLAVFLTLL